MARKEGSLSNRFYSTLTFISTPKLCHRHVPLLPGHTTARRIVQSQHCGGETKQLPSFPRAHPAICGSFFHFIAIVGTLYDILLTFFDIAPLCEAPIKIANQRPCNRKQQISISNIGWFEPPAYMFTVVTDLLSQIRRDCCLDVLHRATRQSHRYLGQINKFSFKDKVSCKQRQSSSVLLCTSRNQIVGINEAVNCIYNRHFKSRMWVSRFYNRHQYSSLDLTSFELRLFRSFLQTAR